MRLWSRPLIVAGTGVVSQGPEEGQAAVPAGGGGAAPVTWRCTRYVAVHLLRGGAPEQKGCNAYGSGVAPTPTSPTADTHTSAMGRHCTTERVRTLLRVCLCGCGPGRSSLLGLA